MQSYVGPDVFEDETLILRVPITRRELEELRDDFDWGRRILGMRAMHSTVEAHGIRLWYTLVKRALAAADRLKR